MVGTKLAFLNAKEIKQRVISISNRVGIVGESHDFPFVFKLAHVQQICHVLKKDTNGGVPWQVMD